MKPTTLVTVLRDILQACRDAYDAADAPTIPVQTYTSHGQAAFLASGDYLVVWSGGISATHPFPLAQFRAVKSTVVPSALVTIEVMRECWPTPHVTQPVSATPSPAAFTAASEAAALDAATIFLHISTLAAKGGLLPSLPTINTAEDVSLSPLVPVGPLGTRLGWRWPLAIKLSVIA